MPKSTVYDVIYNFKAKLSIVRAEGSCRKPGGCDKKLAQKVVRSCKQNPGLSDAERSSRYGSSKSTADDKFKFVKREKYCKKFMIWQAICSCGLKSEPLATSKTFDSKFYIEHFCHSLISTTFLLSFGPIWLLVTTRNWPWSGTKKMESI